VEEDTVVGNPEKLIFYAKDLIGNLSKATKTNINPFYIAGLDLETINFYDFPKVPPADNPYMRQFQEKEAEISMKLAEHHLKPNMAVNQRFFPQLKEYP